MVISGIQKTSTIDYPGQLAAVLFTPGCNYDCIYCHNRSLLQAKYPILPMEEVQLFLERRRGLIDGIVLSGGEITLQPGLKEFILYLKGLGYLVKIDTNGERPEVMEEILPVIDYVALDYKAPWDQYQIICGNAANAKHVQQTLALLEDSAVPYELRTTVYPQMTLKDLRQMASEVKAQPKFVIKPYKMPEEYVEKDFFRLRAKPHTTKDLQVFAAKLKKLQPNIRVQG